MSDASLVRSVSWLSIEQASRVGISAVLGVAVARHLGPESFGVLAVALALASLLGAVLTANHSQLVRRLAGRSREEAPELVGSLLVTNALMGVVLYAVAAAFAIAAVSDPTTRTAIAISCLSLVSMGLLTAEALLQAAERHRRLAIGRIAALLVAAAFRLGAILTDRGPVWFAAAVVVESSTAAVIAWSGSTDRRFIRWSRPDWSDWWPLALTGLAIATYMAVDQVLLGLLASSTATGTYAVAVRLVSLTYALPAVLVTALSPRLLRHANNRAAFPTVMQRFSDVMLALGVLQAVAWLVVGDAVIKSLFGPAYLAASTQLAVLGVAGIAVYAGSVVGVRLIGEGKERLLLRMTSLGAVTNIALNLLLIPRYEGNGAAVATLVSYAVAGWLTASTDERTRSCFRMVNRSLTPRRLATALTPTNLRRLSTG